MSATIPAILAEQAAERGSQIAIIEGSPARERAITFAELAERAEGFAAALTRAEVRKGDAVLVFVPMSIDLYVTLLGIFRVGAVAMFIDPSAGLRHINQCCELLQPAAFVGGWKAQLLGLLSAGVRRTRVKLRPGRTAASIALSGTVQPEDPALITFTSGSTGLPKAAVRTHGFLLAQYAALRRAIHLEPGETDLTTLPIFVLANLACGITSLLPDADLARPGFVDGERIARQIAKHHPTRTGGSPAFYERLAQAGALAGFRKIYTGGAPVFPSLLEQLQTQAPEANVVAVFGSTEAEPIADISYREITPEDLSAMRSGRGLLTGKPVPEIRTEVIRDTFGTPLPDLDAAAFAAMRCGVNEPDEIVVSGPHVLQGYLGGRGNEETKFKVDGASWHRTGDAGYFDAQGRLWLLGRATAKMQVRGNTVYPFAVECVARTFPFVHRSAAVPDNYGVLLVVEFARAISPEESSALLEAVRPHGVTRLRQVRAIPMDRRHNAKVDYPSLRKMLSRE